MEKKKNRNVWLMIDGINHHLSKYKKYFDGSKYGSICPECSLYRTHVSYCWDKRGEPICAILARANNWDDDFAVYFKTLQRK
jgi:hypothetical protein